ncbi:MAG: GNAT family N-acetyltransferase [Abitibacteriaceae bacterium]|nr:GNAT family N-acetyltransferase [Abditibacteriaceae bacterium]
MRNVRQDDLEALLDLYHHLHATDAALPEEPTLRRVWEEILSDPKVHCLVADLNGELVASCILVIIPNLTRGARPYGLIENVITHAAHRRQGIATQLLRYALQAAWSQNCYKVMLLTGRKSEGVHEFYEKLGFVKGEKTGFVVRP